MLTLHDISPLYRTHVVPYIPCNPLTHTHDLKCGHRVTTAPTNERCGSNCSAAFNPVPTPFVCRTCILHSVLCGLGIAPETDSDCYSEADLHLQPGSIVASLVEDEELTELENQYRGAAPTTRRDDIAQFVEDYGRGVLSYGDPERFVDERKALAALDITTLDEKLELVEEIMQGLMLKQNRKEEAADWFR
jgi:hypothetical protein